MSYRNINGIDEVMTCFWAAFALGVTRGTWTCCIVLEHQDGVRDMKAI